MLREVVADTSGDTMEYTTRPDPSSNQQRRNGSLTLHFPFHIRLRSQGSFMETKQEGKRVQFLAVYDVSGLSILTESISININFIITQALDVLCNTAQ